MKNFISHTFKYIIISVLYIFLSGCTTHKPLLSDNKLIIYNIGVDKANNALKCHPFGSCSAWDANYFLENPLIKHKVNLFLKGRYAQKARYLDLVGKSKLEVETLLLKQGFKKEDKTNNLNFKESGEIYKHTDGSAVRIKDYDSSRKFRPQAYAVKLALNNQKEIATWENEIFKISNYGIPLPKAPQAKYGIKASPRGSKSIYEDEEWIDCIMSQVHIDLKKS